jgi:hypothetical protein
MDNKVVIIFFNANKEVIHFYLSARDRIKTDIETCFVMFREEYGVDDGQELKIDYCVWDNWFASEMCGLLTEGEKNEDS